MFIVIRLLFGYYFNKKVLVCCDVAWCCVILTVDHLTIGP
jgi:hypothetical protein